MGVSTGVEVEFAVADQIGGELTDVDHLGRARILKAGAGDGGNRLLEKIRRTVQSIHVLVEDPPHVPAPAQDPFHAQTLRLRVDLRVQTLDHFVRLK